MPLLVLRLSAAWMVIVTSRCPNICVVVLLSSVCMWNSDGWLGDTDHFFRVLRTFLKFMSSSISHSAAIHNISSCDGQSCQPSIHSCLSNHFEIWPTGMLSPTATAGVRTHVYVDVDLQRCVQGSNGGAGATVRLLHDDETSHRSPGICFLLLSDLQRQAGSAEQGEKPTCRPSVPFTHILF